MRPMYPFVLVVPVLLVVPAVTVVPDVLVVSVALLLYLFLELYSQVCTPLQTRYNFALSFALCFYSSF